MKRFLFGFIFACLSLLVSCDIESESEKQSYYAPTSEQIMKTVFTPKGKCTIWSCQVFYGSVKDTNKGTIYSYWFYPDMTYEYVIRDNKYEYIWAPNTKSYEGKVEVFDGKMILHGLYGEEENEKTVNLSKSNEWIKIGNMAYKKQ